MTSFRHAPPASVLRSRGVGDAGTAMARLYLDGWAELPGYNGAKVAKILAYTSPVPQDVVALFSAPNGGFQAVVLQPIIAHYQRPIPEDPAIVLAPVGTVITPGNIASYFGYGAHVDFASSAPPVSQGGVAVPVVIGASAPLAQRAVALSSGPAPVRMQAPSALQGLRAGLFEQILPLLTAPQQAALRALVKGWTDAGFSAVAAESLYLPQAQVCQAINARRLVARSAVPTAIVPSPGRPVRFFGE